MAIEILTDAEKAIRVMFCNTTDWAFGPVFDLHDDVEGFLEWLGEDARGLDEEALATKVDEWRESQ